MFKNLAILLIFVLIGTFSVIAEVPDMKQTRPEFEKFAAQLPYLAIKSVLYDRQDHFFKLDDPNIRKKKFEILDKVTDKKWSKKTLLNLLHHDNPKVRTLAAVALFDREDLSVLPALVKLRNDKAPTFDGHAELSSWSKISGVGPPQKEQTVGQVVSAMVNFYMKPSDYGYGSLHYNNPELTKYWTGRNNRAYSEYWTDRKDRSHCAGWFAVQLARASQGKSKTPKNRFSRIHTLRKRIDELPANESPWVLLWLNGEKGSKVLVTEDELVEVCKKVGPEKLLLMLEGKIPSDDPDLQPRSSKYKRMVVFVLQHAQQLFHTNNSDKLLECELRQRNYKKYGLPRSITTPWWSIAAARLNPDNAFNILNEAVTHFQGKYDSKNRSLLFVAIYNLCGKSKAKHILDWFYEENPEKVIYPCCRAAFIKAMSNSPNGNYILSQIIQDKRFDTIDWRSLKQLAHTVNLWFKTPVVTEKELWNAEHPFVQARYRLEKAEAKKYYPKETAELEAHLKEWRKRLRLSVPELLRANKIPCSKTD